MNRRLFMKSLPAMALLPTVLQAKESNINTPPTKSKPFKFEAFDFDIEIYTVTDKRLYNQRVRDNYHINYKPLGYVDTQFHMGSNISPIKQGLHNAVLVAIHSVWPWYVHFRHLDYKDNYEPVPIRRDFGN